MATFCDTSEVYNKLDALQAIATTAAQDAEFQIVSLENSLKDAILTLSSYLSTPSSNFNTTGTYVPEPTISGVDRPDDSFDPTIDISGIPTLELEDITLTPLDDDEPTLDDPAPVISYSPKPDALDDSRLPDEISLNEVEIPDPFTYTLPDPPEYSTVAIPTINDIDLTDLLSDIEALYSNRPQLTNTQVDGYLSGIEDLANNSATAISTAGQGMIDLFETQMLNNNLFTTEDSFIDVMAEIAAGTRDLGLPSSVEDQMFNSARSRADDELLMAQQEAMTDMASRGFSLPNGVLVYRLDFATQQALLKKKDLNRDMVILHYQEKLKEFWNAVQSVTSISNGRFGLYVQMIDLGLKEVEVRGNLLQAAVAARAGLIQAQVDLFNGSVNLFNARLQAELAQLEEDKIKLELAQLQNTIRLTEVQIYVERVRSIQVQADIFRTQMEGARLELEAEGLRVQNYNAQVEAYGTLVQAKRAEYEAYEAEVRAEVAKIQVYEAQVRAYAERVRAFTEKNSLTIRSDELKLRKQETEVSLFGAKLDGYRATIEARVQQLRGQIEKLSAQTAMYGVDVEKEVAQARITLERVDRVIALLGLDLQAETTDVNTYNDALKLRWQATVEAQRAVLDMYNNLAAAALSALDVAATVSNQCALSASTSV